MKYESARSAFASPTARTLGPLELSAAEARFGLRVSARLNEQAQGLPHDISERLRIARETAVAQARLQARSATQAATGAVVMSTGRGGRAALLGAGGGDAWWFKLSSLVPLLVLVAGFFVIQQWQGEEQILAAADVDSALLGDELPPDAYADPGFGEFLKSGASLSGGEAPSPASAN